MIALWFVVLLAPPPVGPVYPADSTPLTFDHARHAALGLSCGRCHAAADTSVRPGDRLLPDEALCFECHDPRARPPGDPGCATCHPGYRPTTLPADPRRTGLARPLPAPVVLRPAALTFGHRPHLARGATCDDCHRGVAQSTDAAERFLPDMATCVDCHARNNASIACATCHPTGPDGRLETRLPAGPLMPRGRFHPADHRGRFAQDHGALARADGAYCAECHAPADTLTRPGCARCHASAVKPLSLHPADYVRTHGIDARRATDCVGCHRQQTFCLDCHTRSGVSMVPGPTTFDRTGSDGRFHPPGFVGVTGEPAGPAHHRHAARRNLRECTSCHRESDCVTCHAADAALGLRAPSPHPPGFDCATLDRNARGCLKCHREPGALEALCR